MQKYSVKQYQVVWNGYGLHEHFNDLVWSKWEKLTAMDELVTDNQTPFHQYYLAFIAFVSMNTFNSVWENEAMPLLFINLQLLTNFYKRTLGLEGKEFLHLLKKRGGFFKRMLQTYFTTLTENEEPDPCINSDFVLCVAILLYEYAKCCPERADYCLDCNWAQ